MQIHDAGCKLWGETASNDCKLLHDHILLLRQRWTTFSHDESLQTMTGPPRGELFVQTWQSGKMYRILVSDVIKAEAGSQPNAVCMELHTAHQAILNAQLFSFIIVFLLLGKYK